MDREFRGKVRRLPERIPHRKLQALRDEVVKHTAAYDQLAQELSQLERYGREEARKADAAAFAKAKRAGKDDPGAKASDRIEQQIATKRRQFVGMEQAIRDTYLELRERAERYGPALQAKLGQTVHSDVSAMFKAIDTLEQAMSGMSEAVALQRWVAEGVYRTAPADLRLPALLTPAREPYTVSAVVAALREQLDNYLATDEKRTEPTGLAAKRAAQAA